MRKKIFKKVTRIPENLYGNRFADEQLLDIIEEMESPGYVLVSRQMGKTNLLLNAKRNLESENRKFIYVDCSEGFENCTSFFRNITDIILETNKKIASKIYKTIEVSRQKYHPIPSKEFEREIIRVMSAYAGELVIVLDEIDSLTKYSFCDQIFTHIRSTYFKRVNYKELERLTYILSGVVEPSELIQDEDKSPFNIGAPIYLTNFKYKEFEIFIDKVGILFTSNVVERIYYWASGHPRITWDICSELENILISGRSILQKNDVDEVIEKLYRSHLLLPPFDHIKKQIKKSPLLRKACLVLLSGDRTLRDEEIHKLFLAGIISDITGYGGFKFSNRILKEVIDVKFLEDSETYIEKYIHNKHNKTINNEVVTESKSFHKQKFFHYIKLLTSEVFVGEPISTFHRYISSTSGQIRKSYTSTVRADRSEQNDIFLLDETASEIQNDLLLGPYELNVLRTITTSYDGCLFIQGGARSGKSSLMSILQNHCDYVYDKSKSDGNCQSIKPKIDRQFVRIIIVDMSNYDAGFSGNFNINDPDLISDVTSKIFNKIYMMISHTCDYMLGDEGLFADYFYDFYKSMAGEISSNDFISPVINRIHVSIELPGSHDWKKLNIREKKTVVFDAFFGLELCSPFEIFLGTIAPLWFMVYKNNNIDQLVLVIDNIDHIPPCVVQKISDVVRQVCAKSSWNSLFGENRVKVVVPVRLSTFKRRISQHGSFLSLEHKSLYPSTVVSYSLMVFFLYNENYSCFYKVPVVYQKAIISRLYSLWSHLIDRKSYFKNMVDAISGSNIDHGIYTASSWCSSGLLPFGGVMDIDLNFVLQTIRKEIAGEIFMEIRESVFRAIEVSLGDVSEEMLNNNYQAKAAVIVHAVNFSELVGGIIKQYGLLVQQDINKVFSVREQIALKSIDGIKSIIRKELDSPEDDRLFQYSINKVHESVFGCFDKNQTSKEWLLQFNNALYLYLEKTIKLQFGSLQGYDGEFVKLITDWLKMVFSVVIETGYNERAIDSHFSSYSYDITSNSKVLKDFTPNISRFVAGSNLLGVGDNYTTKTGTVENVFRTNDNQLNPVAMHVLYILYFSNDFHLRAHKLLSLLGEYWYNLEKDILPTLNSMVNEYRRLIFVDADDYDIGINKITGDKYVNIYLSSTGKKYYDHLIATPPYLEWSLNDINIKNRKGDIVENVSNMFYCFSILIDKEIDSIRNIERLENAIPGYLCASFDLCLRSFECYLPGLISHYRNTKVHGKYHDAKIVLKLMNNILNTSYDYISVLKDMLNGSQYAVSSNHIVTKWESLLLSSEQEIQGCMKYN